MSVPFVSQQNPISTTRNICPLFVSHQTQFQHGNDEKYMSPLYHTKPSFNTETTRNICPLCITPNPISTRKRREISVPFVLHQTLFQYETTRRICPLCITPNPISTRKQRSVFVSQQNLFPLGNRKCLSSLYHTKPHFHKETTTNICPL